MNPKHEAAAALLAFHDEFLLHLNPAWPDVIVPAHLQGRRTVALHWGTKLAVPIPDFEITGWGVRGTLVFRGQSVYCQVPWASVWAVQSAADATKATVFHPERGWLADVLPIGIGLNPPDWVNKPTGFLVVPVRKPGAQSAAKRPAWFPGCDQRGARLMCDKLTDSTLAAILDNAEQRVQHGFEVFVLAEHLVSALVELKARRAADRVCCGRCSQDVSEGNHD